MCDGPLVDSPTQGDGLTQCADEGDAARPTEDGFTGLAGFADEGRDGFLAVDGD